MKKPQQFNKFVLQSVKMDIIILLKVKIKRG